VPEKFICSIYSESTKAGTKLSKENKVIDVLPEETKKKKGKSPTTDDLQEHIERVNYQAAVWKCSLEAIVDIPPIVGNGWTFTDEQLEPTLVCYNPAPSGLLEFAVYHANVRIKVP